MGGLSSFSRRVLAVAARIPRGRVATYGQLALLAGAPRAARAVGSVMAGCTDPMVPCHRVVDRNGGTKKAFDRWAPGTQRALLEAEGVLFLTDGSVDMEHFLWNPAETGIGGGVPEPASSSG